MPRLFVAIEPPQAIKDQLTDLMEGVPGARWQDDEQLHLTVRFIGEVDRRAASEIEDALARVRHPTLDLALAGTGVFDRRGRPETLWVGVHPHAPLKALHNKVDQALETAGIAPETRAYTPHITIARLGRGAAPLDHFMVRSGGVTSRPWRADELTLYESHLGHEGAHYEPLARYPLG